MINALCFRFRRLTQAFFAAIKDLLSHCAGVNMKFAIILVSTMATLLSACGGGTGTGVDGLQEYQDLKVGFDGLALKYRDETATAVMPTEGTATYTGVAGFLFGAETVDADALAKTASTLTVNANFTNGGMSGSMTDFYYYDGSSVPGSLTITGGPLTGNTFTRPVTGNLFVDGDLRPIAGTVEGFFAGNDAKAVGVVGDLTATGSATAISVFGLAER